MDIWSIVFFEGSERKFEWKILKRCLMGFNKKFVLGKNLNLVKNQVKVHETLRSFTIIR